MNFQLISAPRLHAPPRFSARLKATRRFFCQFIYASRRPASRRVSPHLCATQLDVSFVNLSASQRCATRRISLQLNAT